VFSQTIWDLKRSHLDNFSLGFAKVDFCFLNVVLVRHFNWGLLLWTSQH